ncbi:HypC/HybG/HupF family hydrogenase formation chaperone [Endomicrobium proavitum]|uniref:[NiFe] hydrogenase maturation protein HypC n=1 Tax=Endomicrobium proavitum TaxID=1408281 RepID=A0A0G3WIH0_9BACT|nr:HypC/HybG/HupF family hydrogenase formation chaperone [Endomicrobium proavitum]AKL97685.1 [NiFe] hydrogenase maturation protein HypC [Endomicrobium proavitum]
MCLATVAKITKILNSDTAVADFGGISSEIKTVLIKDLKLKEFVLVHAGFAISKVSQKDAKKIIEASKESGLI